MGTTTNYVVLGLFVFANIMGIVAIAFTLASVFTDEWMITRFPAANGFNHYHGLFTYCVEHRGLSLEMRKDMIRNDIRSNRGYQKTRCRKMGEEPESVLDEMGTWNYVLLGTLIGAAVAGLLAVITGYVSAVAAKGEANACGICSLGSCFVLHLIAAILSIAAVIYFRWMSVDEDYKMEIMPTLDLEAPVEIGSSFTWAIVGCVLFILSTVLALVAGIMKLCGGGGFAKKNYTSSASHMHFKTTETSRPTDV